MAQTTPNRGYFYPEPSDTVEAFPAAQKTSMEKLDQDVETALNGDVNAERLTQTINPDRIPGINAQKLTDGGAMSAIDQSISQKILAALGDAIKSTGPRNIDSLLTVSNGWTGTPSLRVQRVGQLVSFSAENVGRDVDGSGWITVCSLSNGFRPSYSMYSRDFAGGRWRVSSTGDVQVQNPTRALNYFSLTYMSNYSFPSTLPGTPA